MSALDSAMRRLSSAGYETARAGDDVQFEDQTVLGFVREFGSIALLLDKWQEVQDQFLRAHASDLRRDRRKSWNAYSVFLTPERASGEDSQRLLAIEEDFRATRKVVRAGVSTDADIENALAVLLPIRHRVRFGPEDAVGRVSERLSSLPASAVDTLLRGATPEEFTDALLREEQA